MNVSHRYKLVWWATSRCASRFTLGFLSPLVFYNYDKDNKPLYGSNFIFDDTSGQEEVAFSHMLETPAEFADYKVIASIRNPYDYFYSNYRRTQLEYLRGKLAQNGIYEIPDSNDLKYTFKEWAYLTFDKYKRDDFTIYSSKHELTNFDDIDYLIRYEKLKNDIMKIPEVIELYNSNDTYKSHIDSLLNETKDGYRDSIALKSQNFTDVYTEDIANMVYQLYKPQFDTFGYDKDSWKKTVDYDYSR